MKLWGSSRLMSGCLVGSIGLMGAISAQANIYSFTNLQPTTQTLYAAPGPGLFDDFFSFTIPGPDGGAAISSSLFTVADPLAGNVTHISGFSGALLDSIGNSLGPVLTPSGPDFKFSGLLGPGSYQLEVTGTADGTAGGFYSVSMVAFPVPEASTALSAIAGLGMLALVTRRRRFN